MADLDPERLLPDLPWPDPPAPGAKVAASIRQQCTGNLKPKRGLSARARALLTLVLTLAVVAVFGGLAHAERPEGALRAALFGAAGWAVVLLAVLSVGLLRPPGRRSRMRLLLAATVPAVFFGYLAFAASSQLPLGEFFTSGHGGGALGCGLHALLFGAIVGGGTLYLWRGTDPLSPRLSGALVGLVGGLAGAITIGVACPSGETWHLWLGHGAALLTLVACGALFGRRVLSP
ncbi:MAG: NrsF family protein [Polyangiaceae bacterium]